LARHLLGRRAERMKLADSLEIERSLFHSGHKIILTDSEQIADRLLGTGYAETDAE